MTSTRRRRRTRTLALPLALLLSLPLPFASGVIGPTPALAQDPGAEGEQKSTGRSLDGYFLTGLLAGLVLFIVAKSARR